MKNLYLINTKEPSRLDEFGGQWFLYDTPEQGLRNYNIYITSDEKIQSGDWFYNPFINEIQINCNSDGCKKIIQTTDPKLIDDGVQPIRDEFLEWFVNNPECESVEVTCEDYGYLVRNWDQENYNTERLEPKMRKELGNMHPLEALKYTSETELKRGKKYRLYE